MKLLLDRFGFGDDSTLSKLYLVPDGDEMRPLCYVLEDERREVKVPGETAIPTGVYEIRYRAEGGMTKRYAAKFGEWHRGMLELQNVPDFKYVYLHIGNTDEHTMGCLLTGTNAIPSGDGNWTVGQSRIAYEKVYDLIADALDADEDVVLVVRER